MTEDDFGKLEPTLNTEVPTFMVLAYREAKTNIDNLRGSTFEKAMKLGYWSGVAQLLQRELEVIAGESSAAEALADLIVFVDAMLERTKDEA